MLKRAFIQACAIHAFNNKARMNLELYQKMLRGECSPAETRQVMQWLKEAPGALEAAMLQEMNDMQEEGRMPAATRQQMLSFFASRGIAAPGETSVVTMVPVTTAKRKWYPWAAAAAILFLIVAGWLTYPSLNSRASSQAWLQIQNTGTTLQLVTLPDSSKVWLHALATLRYREDFNGHAERKVQLTGEGYFKVAREASHSFVVQTGELNTRVLGTEFNIEAYTDEQFVKVTLQKGKVQVDNVEGKDSIKAQAILLPGQMAAYSKSTTRLLVTNSPMKNQDAWTGEGLLLNDVSLPDALQRVARKYNRELEFDALKAGQHQHITAYYQQMDIEQVLTQLGFTCRFSAEKTRKGGYRIIWE
jgi:ferric-dicitrate binding protein FerR (iron transport regulator)